MGGSSGSSMIRLFGTNESSSAGFIAMSGKEIFFIEMNVEGTSSKN